MGQHQAPQRAIEHLTRAVELCGDREIVLDAQSYLAQWYARFGFVPDGPEFLEDGIPHIPMRREQRAT